MSRTSLVWGLTALTSLLIHGSSQAATVIATTSFEEPVTAAPTTANPFPGSAPGLTYAGGAELGFSSSFTDTRGTGETGPLDPPDSNDFIGVTAFTGDVTAFTDGVQGYQWNDTDGLVTLTLNSVDLSLLTDALLTFDLFVNATGYESDDSFGVRVNGISVYTALEADLDGPLNGVWTPVSIDISAYAGLSSVSVAFDGDTNAGSENFYVDNVVISGTAIPEPGSAAALALLGAAGFARRRRSN